MPSNIDVEFTVPLPPDEYFEKYFYEEEYDKFQAKFLGLKDLVYELSEAVLDDPKKVKRRVKVVPNVPLPSIVLYYLGNEEMHYYDNYVKDHTTRSITFDEDPPIMQTYIKIHGTVSVLPDPDNPNQCKQSIRVHLDVDSLWIPGAAALIESLLAAELERSYGLIPDALKAFLELKSDQANGTVGVPKEDDNSN